MTEIAGVDASYDELTPAKAAALWDAGVRVYAQCLWTGADAPVVRIPNLQVARAQGMILVGYISLTGYLRGTEHVAAARAGVPDDLWDELELTPIDIELAGIENIEIRGAVKRTVELGKKKSIYTSASKWRENQGDDETFTDCLIWIADYDRDAEISTVDLPGGWTAAQLVGKQYTGGEDVNGLEADRDTWNEELLTAMNEADKDRVENLEKQAWSVRQDLDELANGTNALSVANKWPLSLKGLWYVAAKAWPF